MPLLVDFEQGLQNMQEAINTTPTAGEFGEALSLALGSDTSMLYYPSAPSTGNYITTTTTAPIPGDQISDGYITTLPSDFAVRTEIKTIDDIVEEKIEQYKELMRLQALGCKNCGGSINRETMTCEYCGTRYRN